MRGSPCSKRSLLSALLVALTCCMPTPELPPRHGPFAVPQAPSTAIWTGKSFAYLCGGPGTGPLTLVNAGSDPSGQAILRSLQAAGQSAQQVQCVLLTDGLAEHRAGAALFSAAQVYVGEADMPLAIGSRPPKALQPRLQARTGERPKPPAHLQACLAGSILTCGALRWEAVAMPGFTTGSMAYVLDTVAFVGNSLRLQRGRFGVWGFPYSESPGNNARSLSRLDRIKPQVLADSRFGVMVD